MNEIILNDGYKAIFSEDGIVLKNSRGYAKLDKFTHNWADHVIEYGDCHGNRYDISGKSLIENKESDIGNRTWNYIFEGLTVQIKIKLKQKCDSYLKSIGSSR